MKTMKIAIILLILSFRAYSPGNKVVSVYVTDPIQPHEAIWRATCKVESNNNPLAIGDKHLREKSYGIAQIRQSRLDDYYRQTGIRYTTKDMLDTVKAKQVFMYYVSPDPEVTARTWNGGPDGMKKKSTLKYWKLIQANL